jgi:predicted transcriptional regulator
MDSKVSTFAIKDMVCVDMESTVIELVKILAQVSFTAVPVLGANGKCFGIVSAKDVFSLIASGGNINSVKAWEICSHTVIYVDPNITAIQACQVMRENNVHHLIVGDVSEPIGMVSTMDIVTKLDNSEKDSLKKHQKGQGS